MAEIRLFVTAALLILGLVCLCISMLGVYRFKYAANRMHAAAIGDTMGIGLCILGLAVSAPDLFTALKLLLIVLFMWVTSPVASHLLCRLEIETNEQREEYMTVEESLREEEKKREENA